MNELMLDVENAVSARYSLAARETQRALCCPVEYDPRLLRVIPDEILERDYGCGDPSAYVSESDVVLDLGSGGGKICYIAAQLVGPGGRVLGVDMNDEMLALAKRHQPAIAAAIDYDNVRFYKGRIQDLALQTASVDVVISNCVLNLVSPAERGRLLAEVFRVLKTGGRVAISDIVSDEDVPPELQNDPDLWSGCIAGAYREDALLHAFERAGFHGIHMAKRDEQPWRVVNGIEFRALTVVAYKGKQGPCVERNQAVIYRGPWKQVCDHDGHVLERGKLMAVCDKTFRLYQQAPYAADIIPVYPLVEVSVEQAGSFDCSRDRIRDPRESKGMEYNVTTDAKAACEPGSDCC